jgi:hypothetical protein
MTNDATGNFANEYGENIGEPLGEATVVAQ